MSTTISSPATLAPIDRSRSASPLPPAKAVLSSMLRADLTTQWRNRRASIMVILIPTIILMAWKGVAEKFGGAFALSNCITVGLNAIGLMGFTNSVARDREKGIFQRLRITPAPRWTIMVSRLIVQLLMIAIITLLLFIVGYQFDHITMKASGYALAFFAAIVGGAVYLSLGQIIVGLVRNPETVNVTTRLVYFLFIMIGMFGMFGMLGNPWTDISKWSPYGTVQRILADSLSSGAWSITSTYALLATIGYTLVFSFMGIRWFRWQPSK